MLLDICTIFEPKQTEAERVREYREDIKQNYPEKYEESKNKSNDRYFVCTLCFRICFSALAKSTATNVSLTTKLNAARAMVQAASSHDSPTKKPSTANTS